MGHLALLLALALLPLTTGPAAAAPAGPLEPVGTWLLDEGVGLVASDASGNENHGVLQQQSGAWTPGVRGTAIAFPAADLVTIANSPTFDFAGGFTIASWMRPNRAGTQYPIKKARHDRVDGFELSLSGSAGKTFVRFNQASSGNDYKIFSLSDYPVDGATWMHAAATFDGSTIRLYIDGVLEASGDAPGLVIADNDLPLAFGSQDDGRRPYDGGLDEVVLFDHALSEAEIQGLMQTGPPGSGGDPDPDPDADGDGVPDGSDAFPNDPSESADADGDGIGDNADLDDDDDGMPDAWELQYGFDPLSPLDASADADLDGDSNLREFQLGTNPRDPIAGALAASYSLDEGAGIQAADGSGLGNHGLLVAGPAWTAGVAGGALDFAGGPGRVVIADAPALDLDSEFSLMAWIRPGSLSTQYVLKKARYDASDGYELGLSSGGPVFVRLNQVSARNTYKLMSHRSYPTDGLTWLHVAATFDGQEVRLYLDGVLDAVLSAPGLRIGQNDDALSIGAQDDGTRPFDGAVDDVFVYSRPLSYAEVEAAALGIVLTDTDGDGFLDPDDAFPNDPQEWADTDGDGTGDNADSDDDGDGMPDAWEAAQGFDPLDPADAAADADLDGVSNLDEYLQGTNPRDPIAPAMIGSWSMDERDGLTVADASGLGHDGLLVGRVFRIPGVVDGAIGFHDDHMLVADTPILDLSAGLTIAAWIQPDHRSTQYVIKKARSDGADGYEIGLSSGGQVFFRLNQASAGNTYKLFSSRPYPVGGQTWGHVAATFDGDEMRLYLDGALEGVLGAPGLVPGANDLPLSVVAEDDGSRSFEGGVDELKLFNHALSEAEVQALFAYP